MLSKVKFFMSNCSFANKIHWSNLLKFFSIIPFLNALPWIISVKAHSKFTQSHSERSTLAINYKKFVHDHCYKEAQGVMFEKKKSYKWCRQEENKSCVVKVIFDVGNFWCVWFINKWLLLICSLNKQSYHHWAEKSQEAI